MAFGNLCSVLKIFGGSSGSEKTRDEIYREVLMMTLAEASRADAENKATILQELIDVIKSDAEINVLEIDFFNQVIKALRMSPAEQQGLTT